MGQSFIINRSRGGSSGGTGGGLAVKCSAQRPSAVSKNTVWVQTDMPKGDVTVSAGYPTGKPDGKPFKEGDIWVAITSLPYDNFPIVKGQRLGGVFQWIKGMWTPRQSEIWDGERWLAFSSAFGESRYLAIDFLNEENDFNILFTDPDIGTSNEIDWNKYYQKKIGNEYGYPRAYALTYPPGPPQFQTITLNGNAIQHTTIRNIASSNTQSTWAVLLPPSDKPVSDYNLQYYTTFGTGSMVFSFIDFEKEGVSLDTPFWVTRDGTTAAARTMAEVYFPTLNKYASSESITQFIMTANASTNLRTISLETLTDFKYGVLFISSGDVTNTIRLATAKLVKRN